MTLTSGENSSVLFLVNLLRETVKEDLSGLIPVGKFIAVNDPINSLRLRSSTVLKRMLPFEAFER